jgi:hypothetical protein
MPDLRSLEERIAELVREELDNENVRVCCNEFEYCRTPCTVRADYWKGVAQGLRVAPPAVRKPSEPQPSQLPPSSLPKDPKLFALFALAALTLSLSAILAAIAAWSVICR